MPVYKGIHKAEMGTPCGHIYRSIKIAHIQYTKVGVEIRIKEH